MGMPCCLEGALVCNRDAKVKSLEKFGLFVEILPGKEGLVHTSELDVDRSVSVGAFSVGDTMDVKLVEVSVASPFPVALVAVDTDMSGTGICC